MYQKLKGFKKHIKKLTTLGDNVNNHIEAGKIVFNFSNSAN